jgi:hypothetical protein
VKHTSLYLSDERNGARKCYEVSIEGSMWTKTSDGTVLDRDGKVVFFSAERFVNDICLGACCFICGVAPGIVDFNDEHILPDWLLRRYDLHQKTVNLPNATLKKYAGYRIQCCKSCNSMMAKWLRNPSARYWARA